MGQNGPKMRKASMFRLFSWEMPHNCCFLLYALIIDAEKSTSLLTRTKFSYGKGWVNPRNWPRITIIAKNGQKLYESQRF